MDLDIAELVAANTNENGEFNKESFQENLNNSISENFISNVEHQKQIGAVSAKAKKKYQNKQTPSSTNANEGEGNVETNQQAEMLTVDEVQKMISQANNEREKAQAKAALVETQVSDVKEEFKEFLKYKIANEKDFDVEKFLSENPSYKSVKNTTSAMRTNVAESASRANMNAKQKRLLQLSGL